MPERIAHLVGSLPVVDVSTAMELSVRELGSHLLCVPDGETGERRNWIVHTIEQFRRHPDLAIRRNGDWSSFAKTPFFKVRKGHELRSDTLNLGHLEAATVALPILRQLRDQYHLPKLRLQAGIPGDLDMAFFTFGPLGFRHRQLFAKATEQEMQKIHALGGDEIIFQLELPLELIITALAPAPIQQRVATALARGVLQLVQRAPAGSKFGVHLCLGDLNHKAFTRMRHDVRPLVHLANALVAGWPANRPLEYIHAPFAAGDKPPSLNPTFYRPLQQLHIPKHSRFIAGFVHEGRTVEEHNQILGFIEQFLDCQVGISTACGMGRRSEKQSRELVHSIAELTANDSGMYEHHQFSIDKKQ